MWCAPFFGKFGAVAAKAERQRLSQNLISRGVGCRGGSRGLPEGGVVRKEMIRAIYSSEKLAIKRGHF